MNQASKNQAINIRPGKVIVGKWHQNRYVIKKPLGNGAIGSVFLCQHNDKLAALKISSKGSSITMEVNVLKTFQKVQGKRLGPSLLDVDDWIDDAGNRFSFYVMDYLRGEELFTFLRTRGEEWLGILVLQLLDDLEALHNQGWVFGDLKPENLIVTHSPPRLRWIDVGGTTQIGRSIKEYTEFFDRGYWNMGSRKAEPSYDLFALAMVMIEYYYPQRFEKGSTPKRTLLEKVSKKQQLRLYEPVIKKAIMGHYQSSIEMKQDMVDLMLRQSDQHQVKKRKTTHHQTRTKTVNQQTQKKIYPFFESIGIVVTVLLMYLFYLVFV